MVGAAARDKDGISATEIKNYVPVYIIVTEKTFIVLLKALNNKLFSRILFSLKYLGCPYMHDIGTWDGLTDAQCTVG